MKYKLNKQEHNSRIEKLNKIEMETRMTIAQLNEMTIALLTNYNFFESGREIDEIDQVNKGRYEAKVQCDDGSFEYYSIDTNLNIMCRFNMINGNTYDHKPIK